MMLQRQWLLDSADEKPNEYGTSIDARRFVFGFAFLVA